MGWHPPLEGPHVLDDVDFFPQIMEEAPLVFPRLLDDKHQGVPGAVGLYYVAPA